MSRRYYASQQMQDKSCSRTSGVPFGSRKSSGTPYDLVVSAPDLSDGDGFAAYSVRARLWLTGVLGLELA